MDSCGNILCLATGARSACPIFAEMLHALGARHRSANVNHYFFFFLGTFAHLPRSGLAQAIERVEHVEGHAYEIDPKALTKEELYGAMDPTTREWRDGVFTRLLRTIVDASPIAATATTTAASTIAGPAVVSGPTQAGGTASVLPGRATLAEERRGGA